jgi:gluconokinase
MKPRFFIIMGVSSSGKTTVGKALAARLGWEFYDGDDYHPLVDIEKMTAGVALNDEDRLPWLAALQVMIAFGLKHDHPGVLACSALKESYRQVLLKDNQGVVIVYLKGDIDLIHTRMADRADHYMKPGMLKSQFEVLEEPVGALTMDISLSVETIVEKILETMKD